MQQSAPNHQDLYRRPTFGLLALLLATGLSSVRCRGQQSGSTTTPTSPAAIHAKDDTKLNVRSQTNTPAVGDVPWAITDVGQLGQNIYEAAQQDNWDRAGNDFYWLNRASAAARGTVAGPMADQRAKAVGTDLYTSVAALGQAIRAKDKTGAMLDANKITLVAAALGAPYAHQVPYEVSCLDYDGRQMQVYAATKDMEGLQATLRDMEAKWLKLRPRVVEDQAGAEAKRFDAILTLARAAMTPQQYAAVAQQTEREVDVLQGVFLAHRSLG